MLLTFSPGPWRTQDEQPRRPGSGCLDVVNESIVLCHFALDVGLTKGDALRYNSTASPSGSMEGAAESFSSVNSKPKLKAQDTRIDAATNTKLGKRCCLMSCTQLKFKVKILYC